MKRWARVSLKILGGLLLGVVTLAAAWAAFNNRLVDDAPRPVPEALRVPAPTLPPERNAVFALLGLAEAGDDPHAAGLRRWAAMDAGAITSLPASPRKWPASETRQPASKAWGCDTQTTDCVAVWMQEADALRALTAAHADIGRRCEAVAQTGMAIDEPMITPSAELNTAGQLYIRRATLLPWQTTVNCLRWLHLRSALAGQSGDRAAMLTLVKQADALTGAMLDGTNTLIGVNVAGAMARRHWRVVTDLAAAYPAAAPELRAMLRPMSARAADTSRWIRTEANFGREAVREYACMDLGADASAMSADSPFHCEPRFWAMPNATQHLLDKYWLQAEAKSGGGALNMLDWEPDPSADWALGFPWRNSIGGTLVAVAAPGFPIYVRKQASLMLLNEAARLALAAGDVEPARRAVWLSQQPMDARLRERLAIDGEHVVARLWAPVSSQDTLRYRIPSGATSAATVTGSNPDPSPTKS
ncbi:hypothetical protein [Roseateles chitinivorans]|uniref:hypothetical protein n=1 Tax=Roseateles chitinivorans TaxID=2917965 RepID=UPI003D667739